MKILKLLGLLILIIILLIIIALPMILVIIYGNPWLFILYCIDWIPVIFMFLIIMAYINVFD